jgi:hypothetical protein
MHVLLASNCELTISLSASPCARVELQEIGTHQELPNSTNKSLTSCHQLLFVPSNCGCCRSWRVQPIMRDQKPLMLILCSIASATTVKKAAKVPKKGPVSTGGEAVRPSLAGNDILLPAKVSAKGLLVPTYSS